jgi:biotin-(acetyl-CoA carboxylase) ligase
MSLEGEVVAASLTTAGMGRTCRAYPIAVSVDALAQAWLRQEAAPQGALVLADREISPRTRSGEAWPARGGLYVAVVLRPQLRVEAANLLWVLAAVAAARAYPGPAPPLCRWPDRLVTAGGGEVAMVAVNTQLGPGGVAGSVLTFRLEEGSSRLPLLDRLLNGLEELVNLPATALVDNYAAGDVFAGRVVELRLAPRGRVRGKWKGPDAWGRAQLETDDGSVEVYTIDQIRSVDIVS